LAYYYVNDKAQSNGDHEVHVPSCKRFPDEANRTYLGNFSNCEDAVAEAKKKYPRTANGCYYCSNPCHTT
jgi:hypothetical protein